MEWPSSTPSDHGATDPTLSKAAQLERAFVRVQGLLDPRELPRSGLRSATDMVHLALREEWLDEEDVKGPAPGAGTKKDAKKKPRLASRRTKHVC